MKKKLKRIISIIMMMCMIMTMVTPIYAKNDKTKNKPKDLISVCVWWDRNENGKKDSGENGIDGLTISSYFGKGNQFFDETTKSSNGDYEVLAGNHGNDNVIKLDLDELKNRGYKLTNKNDPNVDPDKGEIKKIKPPASINIGLVKIKEDTLSSKITINVTDSSNQSIPQYINNGDNATIDKIINPPVRLSADPTAKISYSGVSEGKYQFVKGSNLTTKPQFPSDSTMTNIDLPEPNTREAYKDDLGNQGYINTKHYEYKGKAGQALPRDVSFGTPVGEGVLIQRAIVAKDIYETQGEVSSAFILDIAKGNRCYSPNKNAAKKAMKVWGYFKPEKTGSYLLGAYSDDGAYGYLMVDGVKQVFVEDWRIAPPQFRATPAGAKKDTQVKVNERYTGINLVGGKYYPIYMEWYEGCPTQGAFVPQYIYNKNLNHEFSIPRNINSGNSSNNTINYSIPSQELYSSKTTTPGDIAGAYFGDVSGISFPSEDGTYYIATKFKSGKGTTQGMYGPFIIDNTKPAISNLVVTSNNTNEEKWAEAGNTLTIKFTASEDLTSNPQILINEYVADAIITKDSQNNYTSIVKIGNDGSINSYEIGNDGSINSSKNKVIDGPIKVKIDHYSDLSGNEGDPVQDSTVTYGNINLNELVQVNKTTSENLGSPGKEEFEITLEINKQRKNGSYGGVINLKDCNITDKIADEFEIVPNSFEVMELKNNNFKSLHFDTEQVNNELRITFDNTGDNEGVFVKYKIRRAVNKDITPGMYTTSQEPATLTCEVINYGKKIITIEFPQVEVELKEPIKAALTLIQNVDKNNYKMNEEFYINYKIQPDYIPCDDYSYLKDKEIAIVFDKSGSMDFNGRMQPAKNSAISFVNKFKKDDKTKITFISYSTQAEEASKFYTNTEMDTLIKKINDEQCDSSGGTNIGDGIRKAYYALKNSGNSTAKKYIVLMTDGVPTAFSYNGARYNGGASKNGWEYAEDESIGKVHDYRNDQDPYEYALNYAKTMGERVSDDSLDINTYVIGFSNGINADKLQQIADSSNGFYKEALESENLQEVYNQIADVIKSELPVENVLFEETIPKGIEIVEPLPNGLEIVGNKIKGNLGGIYYTLNEDETQFEAEPLEFKLKIKGTSEGTFNIGGKINYTDIDKTSAQKEFPNINVEIARRELNIPTISANEEWTNANAVPVIITADTDDVVKIQYKLSGATTQDWIDYTGEFNIINEGEIIITARTIDDLGNTSQVSTKTVRMDRTPPDAPTITANPTTKTSGNVTVTINYPSDASVKEYRINNGDWLPYTGEITLSENATIYARCYDKVGNESQISELEVNNIHRTPITSVTRTFPESSIPLSTDYKLVYNIDGDEIKYTQEKPVEIVLVLNTSGTMKTYIENKKLLDAAKSFIDNLPSDKNIQVGVVRYYYKGAVVSNIENISNKDRIKRNIDKITTSINGTNLGDGLRRAYQMLDNGTDADKHLVILSDGYANVGTKYSKNGSYVLDLSTSINNNIDNERYYFSPLTGSNGNYSFPKDTNNTRFTIGHEYVKGIAEEVNKSGIKINSHMIHFKRISGAGTIEGAMQNNNEVASALGVTTEINQGQKFYLADDADSLVLAFNNVGNAIKNSVPFNKFEYEETFPAGVELVDYPSGLTKTGTFESGYTLTGNILGINMKKDLESNLYKVDGAFSITVKMDKPETYHFNEGKVTYEDPFEFEGETTVNAGTIEVIDNKPPIASSVTITSNNQNNNSLAKVGDIITLTIETDEGIKTPIVTIAGKTANVTGSGRNWTATYTMQSDDVEGIVGFTLDFEDDAGNTAKQVTSTTDGSHVTFKTPPEVTIEDTVMRDNIVNNNEKTNVTINGTTEANVRVTVTITDGNNTVTGTATADANGNYSVSELDVSNLAEGDLTITTTATDGAGNTGTATKEIEKDTIAPMVTIEDTVMGDNIVNNNEKTNVTINGTTEANVRVTVTITDGNNTVTGTATADANGNYSVSELDVSNLAEGDLTITTRATDSAGNTGTATKEIEKEILIEVTTGMLINNEFREESQIDLVKGYSVKLAVDIKNIKNKDVVLQIADKDAIEVSEIEVYEAVNGDEINSAEPVLGVSVTEQVSGKEKEFKIILPKVNNLKHYIIIYKAKANGKIGPVENNKIKIDNNIKKSYTINIVDLPNLE